MKYVWSHMQNCEEAECPIPLCDRLADIISHWTKCYVEEDRECPLCTPVKERQTRKNLKGQLTKFCIFAILKLLLNSARRRLPQRQQPPSSNAVPIMEPHSPSSTLSTPPKQLEAQTDSSPDSPDNEQVVPVKTQDERVTKKIPIMCLDLLL
jgi:TAZ zinc finger